MGLRRADPSDRSETAAALEAQRMKLFRASAILHICKHACASKLEGFDIERLALAIDVIDDLVNDADAALEQLPSEEASGQRDGDS